MMAVLQPRAGMRSSIETEREQANAEPWRRSGACPTAESKLMAVVRLRCPTREVNFHFRFIDACAANFGQIDITLDAAEHVVVNHRPHCEV